MILVYQADENHTRGERVLQVYLGITPREYRSASRFSRNFAHVAYRIGEGSSLLRQELLMNVRGGLLTIGDRAAPPVNDPKALTAAVLRECSRHSYNGVLLDFEATPRQDLGRFACQLTRELRSIGPLYVPESYSTAVPDAIPLVCTAVSGGSFPAFLQDCAQRYKGRFALDVQRLRMDFLLPAKSGTGTPLSDEAFQTLFQQEKPSVFFSQDLCARYFTYLRDGETHFVLYDDADTISRKLRTGASMRLPAAFLMWPEISDIADRIFRQ